MKCIFIAKGERMFKFDIIHVNKKPTVLKQFNSQNQKLGASDKLKEKDSSLRTTFIVAENLGKSIIGGACLVKKNSKILMKLLESLLPLKQ